MRKKDSSFGLSKHRTMGHAAKNGRTKMAVQRTTAELSQKPKRTPKMYDSIQDLMRD